MKATRSDKDAATMQRKGLLATMGAEQNTETIVIPIRYKAARSMFVTLF